MECRSDDLSGLAPIIFEKYRQLEKLREEISSLNRAAFPRNAYAVFVKNVIERVRVKIGDRIGTDIYVTESGGERVFCVTGDKLILVNKIPGEL